MKKRRLSALMLGTVWLASSSCTTPRYAYHSVYKVTSCAQPFSRDRVIETLVKSGYLHSSERHGPYDVFHKPQIVKKGPLAQEPYEDLTGDIAVAICAGTSENYIATEEWRSCKNRKDCTASDQASLKKIAEDWGCQVSERQGHSESWKLEDRQDWNKETCSFIATQLVF